MDGPQGWSDLFREVSELMQLSSRQFSSANEEYVEYVLERLSICIRTVSAVTNRVDEEVAWGQKSYFVPSLSGAE